MIGVTETPDIQNVFRALADPTRRGILQFLGEQDMTIGEVCEHFDMTRAAIKKHLNILEEGELISVHVNGRERINCLEPQRLKFASEWINCFSHFWDEKLNKLQSAIEREQKNTPLKNTSKR